MDRPSVQRTGTSLGPGSRVAVVGAGISGLVTGRTLREFGFEASVLDRAPDIGGVWSLTRRYPGLRTQNSKHTYHFSDHPMPRSYPRTPTGEQVQAHLRAYVRTFGLDPLLRLRTEVVSARPADGGWPLS